MKICLSLGIPDLERVLDLIKEYELVEIRIDLCGFGKKEIAALCAKHEGLIFTFRRTKKAPDQSRLDLLLFAVGKGARYIDADIGNQDYFLERLVGGINQSEQTKLICSFHDYQGTPTNQVLFDRIIEMGKWEPAIKKIVCTSHGERDNERILSFNSSFSNTIAFNMGDKGRSTRIKCVERGAPFTYIALENHKTAKGQMTLEEMKNELIY